MWMQDFVRCVEGSTLGWSRLDEALAIKQAHLPKRIYKYRRDCSHSRENLKTDTVWLCSPDSYNDPYDCAFKLSDDRVVRAFKRRLVDNFVSTFKLQDVISKDQVENAKNTPEPLKAIAGCLPNLSDQASGGNPKRMAEFCSVTLPQLVGDALSIVRQWRKVTKLSSFSAISDSLLMWSHYAENHHGFCLEYDLEGLEEKHPFRKYLYPVIYSNRLYDLTSWAEKLVIEDRQAFNPDAPLLGILHKFDGWKYEEEWRLVSVTQAIIDDHNMALPTPTRVFLGSRMDVSKKSEVLAICREKEIEVSQMRLAEDRFELLSEQLAP
jgi:hypothetical protein